MPNVENILKVADAIADRMVADMESDPHFGASVAQRIRIDGKLAWLRSQRTSMDVSSLRGLVAHWNDPEAHRQERIKDLILAREAQLRGFPGTFHAHMIRARHKRNMVAIMAAYPAELPAIIERTDARVGSLMARYAPTLIAAE